MRFVETHVFTELVCKSLDDDAYRHMLFLYRKNEQGDLTATQTRTLARVVREEFS